MDSRTKDRPQERSRLIGGAKRALLIGISLGALAACQSYPVDYGSAKLRAHYVPSDSSLTTQVSPLPWSERSRWLQNYMLEINFEVGSHKIDDLDKIRIAEFVEHLNLWDPEVFVEGHADSTGSAEFNRGLAERRAESVRRAMVDAGLEASRISIKSYGDRQPVATNLTKVGRDKNRRAFVIVTPRPQ